MMAVASISTPETEAWLAAHERYRGSVAKAHGQSRESCPWTGGAAARYWLEGWDSGVSPADIVKAFPSGGPLLGGGC
jgi:ribosome modulation factor